MDHDECIVYGVPPLVIQVTYIAMLLTMPT